MNERVLGPSIVGRVRDHASCGDHASCDGEACGHGLQQSRVRVVGTIDAVHTGKGAVLFCKPYVDPRDGQDVDVAAPREQHPLSLHRLERVPHRGGAVHHPTMVRARPAVGLPDTGHDEAQRRGAPRTLVASRPERSIVRQSLRRRPASAAQGGPREPRDAHRGLQIARRRLQRVGLGAVAGADRQRALALAAHAAHAAVEAEVENVHA